MFGTMAEVHREYYSVQVVDHAGKLEQYQRGNRISFQDSGIMIEKSSEIYFKK